jgi:hypothetical protein
MPDAVSLDQRLSDGAKETYAALLRYCFDKSDCWPGEELLANDRGKSSRTIRRHIGELLEARHIAIVVESTPRGRRNHYHLLTLPALPPPQGNVEQPKAEMSGGVRTLTSGGVRTETSQEIHQAETHEVESSSAAAAAAVSDGPEKIQEAAEALVSVRMSREQAEHFARRDAGLALAVVTYFMLRRADPGRKPIHSPVAFVRHCLDHPAKDGFSRDEAGAWHPPREYDAARAPARDPEKDLERAAKWRQIQHERKKAEDNQPEIAAILEARKEGRA